MDINHFIPSFGEFLIYCNESNINKELSKKILFEFLDNPTKYNTSESIKNYLTKVLDINSYIELVNKLNL